MNTINWDGTLEMNRRPQVLSDSWGLARQTVEQMAGQTNAFNRFQLGVVPIYW